MPLARAAAAISSITDIQEKRSGISTYSIVLSGDFIISTGSIEMPLNAIAFLIPFHSSDTEGTNLNTTASGIITFSGRCIALKAAIN